jgi:ABC-type polysaccharide/polyol phosphate transport system ATPase subunit
MSGLVPVARGEVWVGGRPLLLRAGVGFREEATGRQNIVLAGCYLHVSPRRLRALVGEIVEFAELGEAIDRPLKHYSDGMRARLIFALATSVSPDVLMLDELLGAGDARFQDKAVRRLEAMLGRARAVVVVTHGLDWVRAHCTKALYLSRGRQRYFGHPDVAVSRYLDDLHRSGPEVSA